MQAYFSKYIPALIALWCVSANLQAQIVVNEYCPSNKGNHFDNDGDASDWIEIYNPSSSNINLSGFALSDDSTETEPWEFPQIDLGPGQFMIVFASGKDRRDGQLHTDFSLRAGDEPVVLWQQGEVLQILDAPCVPSNMSYGLVSPQGTQAIFKNPTPGNVNDTSDLHYPDLSPATLTVSHPAGFYQENFMLSISSNAPVKLTLDGDEPDEGEDFYSEPVQILDRTSYKDKFADESTSPEWKDPDGRVAKGTVVRAVAWRDGCPVSDEFTGTYFVDRKYTLPVIAITAHGDDLFDPDGGIYVPGTGERENYNQKGNAWERKGHMEYFINGARVFDSGVGLRIHGRDSRNRPQKSLRIYARDKYGADSLYYPFFPDKPMQAYKRLLIRTTWNHRTSTLFKDELAHELVKNTEVGNMAWEPVVLFINGEYWGIHNLRERQDRHYIAGNYGVDPDNLDMLGVSLDGDEEIEGDEMAWNSLMDYVRTTDLSIQENYEQVEKQVNIQSFIDYQIAYLFFANYDWPRNNIRYWRERSSQGKWRWLFFDCDVCFIQSFNSFSENLVHGSEKYDPYTELFRHLFKNEIFRKHFSSTFFRMLNENFSPDHVIPLVDSIAGIYAPEVPEHIRRWHFPANFEMWQNSVDQVKEFSMKRPLEVASQLNELFGPQLKVHPNPAARETRIDFAISGEVLNYRLLDVSGRQVDQGRVSDGSILSLENFENGVYFLIIEWEQFRFNTRLVIAGP